MIFENATESYDAHAKIAGLDEVDGMFKKSHASLKVREHNTLKKKRWSRYTSMENMQWSNIIYFDVDAITKTGNEDIMAFIFDSGGLEAE